MVKKDFLNRANAPDKAERDKVEKEMFGAVPTSFVVQYLTFRLLLGQYQIRNIPNKFRMTEGGIFSEALPANIKYRKTFPWHVFSEIGDFCGLPSELQQSLYSSLPQWQKGLTIG